MMWSERSKNGALRALLRNSGPGGRKARSHSASCRGFKTCLGQYDAYEVASQLDRVSEQNWSCEAGAAMLGFRLTSARTSGAMRDETAHTGQKFRPTQHA